MCFGEQIVGQELKSLKTDLNTRRNYWARDKKDSSAEVNFVWSVDSQLIPIEVKTGHNSSLRSLHSFMDESPYDVAVRVWSGKFSIDDVQTTIKRKNFKLINLPFTWLETWTRLSAINDEEEKCNAKYSINVGLFYKNNCLL